MRCLFTNRCLFANRCLFTNRWPPPLPPSPSAPSCFLSPLPCACLPTGTFLLTHMPFILKEKLKFSLQRGHESTKTPGHQVS